MHSDPRRRRIFGLTATLLSAAVLLVLLLFATLPGSSAGTQAASGPGAAQQAPAATPLPTPPALPAAFWMPLIRYPGETVSIACAQWSLELDLRVVSHTNPAPDSCGNPNVWHLLGGPAADGPSAATLLGTFESDVQGLGLEGWRRGADAAPYLFTNPTSSTQLLDGQAPVVALSVVAHPAVTEVLVVGWRSPLDGRIAITGSVSDIDPRGSTGMRWSIETVGETLAAGETPANGSQSLRDGTGGNALRLQSVSRGDFIYLLLQGQDVATGENTRLDWRITLLPGTLALDGPDEVPQGVQARYTATVGPGQIVGPINWLWRATDQAQQNRQTNGVIDSTSYVWGIAGRKVISVTAATAEGEVTGSRVVTVTGAPALVAISGVSTGSLGAVLAYTASVSPAFTALPITYTWQASGQPVVTHTVAARTDSNTYTWNELGEQTITVTVRNAFGDAAGTYGVFIEKRLYSPIVRNTQEEGVSGR